MKIKRGATIKGLDIRMRPLLQAAERVWQRHGVECVITSGLREYDLFESLHPWGRAVDLRTRYFDDPDAVVRELYQEPEVTGDYDVIYHKNHIHAEYDPKQEG
jgi:hypothetical protein